MSFCVTPGAHGPHAGEVVHDRDAAVLDVEAPGVLALGLDDQVAQEPGRRAQVERPPGHLAHERRARTGAAHRGVEGRLGVERARHLPEVVADRRQHGRLRVGAVHPPDELLDELRERPAQLRMHGHRVADAPGDAGRLEPRGDALGERGEVGVGIGRARHRLVDERVVLVGVQRLLVARGAAEREPRPRARRVAEIVDREREQLLGHRVDDERADPAHVDRVGVRAHHRRDEVRQVPAGLGDRARRSPRARSRSSSRTACAARAP